MTFGTFAGVLAHTRRRLSTGLDRAESHLRAWQAALDPEFHRWAVEARAALADGSAHRYVTTRDDLLRLLHEEEERRTVQR